MALARSDVEIIARTRVLIASLAIYLLTMGFMELGERLYSTGPGLVYSRLAAIPFFLLLVIRWLRLVRVRPPEELREARQLIARGRPRAARDRLAAMTVDARRVDRARRLLQDGLAVPVADEILLESGRCSLELGEIERAIEELGQVWARLPARAEVAIDLAEALWRAGREPQAADTLQQALPYMDALDARTLAEQPALLRLLDGASPPARSAFHGKILRERLLLSLLVAAALAHGLHFFLGIF